MATCPALSTIRSHGRARATVMLMTATSAAATQLMQRRRRTYVYVYMHVEHIGIRTYVQVWIRMHGIEVKEGRPIRQGRGEELKEGTSNNVVRGREVMHVFYLQDDSNAVSTTEQ